MEKSEIISGLKKDLKFKEIFSEKKAEETEHHNANFNPSKSMASNIYYHARASS